MAKSRQKQLDRMERLTPPEDVPVPNFSFITKPVSAQILLTATDLSIGYDRPLLPQLNFSINNGEKLGLTGFNGIGKSTLIKTLLQKIPALSGNVAIAENVAFNYVSQDFEWENKYDTPLDIVADAFPRLKQKEVRSHLARCGIIKENTQKYIHLLSGGEQMKVKMCLATIQAGNLLIMDEPTNHLDQQAKDQLAKALNDFEGTVLLVSHEEAFYTDWIDRVINLETISK